MKSLVFYQNDVPASLIVNRLAVRKFLFFNCNENEDELTMQAYNGAFSLNIDSNQEEFLAKPAR